MKWGILATGTIATKFAKTINAMSGANTVLSRRVPGGSANFSQPWAAEHYWILGSVLM